MPIVAYKRCPLLHINDAHCLYQTMPIVAYKRCPLFISNRYFCFTYSEPSVFSESVISLISLFPCPIEPSSSSFFSMYSK